MTSQVHVEPADHDGHGCVAAHGNEEEGHVLHTNIVVDVEKCSESSQSNTDWDDRERQSVAELIGEPGNDHGQGEGAHPRWHRTELSLNWRVTETGKNGWCEEGVSVGWDDEAEVHEAAQPDLVVLEAACDVATGDLALDGGVALVDAETGGDVGALLLSKPLCVLRESWQEEEECECDEAGEETLEDENPSPSSVTIDVVHLSDGGSQKTAESTGERGGGEEEGISFLCFLALIPHANKVEAAWEHASLSDTQEEASDENAAVVLGETLAQGYETEGEHAAREPETWGKLLEEDIGWNLEKNICWKGVRDGVGKTILGSYLRTKKMVRTTLYLSWSRPRSSSRPNARELATLTRSMKARR